LTAAHNHPTPPQVFGRIASGQGTGTIGKLTHGLVTRELYYTHAVQMALVPFLNPELYPEIAGLPWEE